MRHFPLLKISTGKQTACNINEPEHKPRLNAVALNSQSEKITIKVKEP